MKEGAWKDALDQGAGTLMVEAFKPLGGFGKFCAVVLALGPSKLIHYPKGGKSFSKSVQSQAGTRGNAGIIYLMGKFARILSYPAGGWLVGVAVVPSHGSSARPCS